MLGLALFFTSLILLLIGIPAGFAFGMSAVIFAFIFLEPSIMGLLPHRIYGFMQNTTLIAIPLFIFMGLVLEKSEIAKNLLLSFAKSFGKVRGGLGVGIVLVGAILGASMGIVGATVVMMSIISLPIMLQAGYSKSFSSGIISASGTLGQIIPPSIVLILLADSMSLNVGELFRSVLIPSILLIVFYVIYILIASFIKKDLAPAIEIKDDNLNILSSLIPALILILIVLGSIFFGITTPAEASAIGAIGAVIITILNKTFSISMIKYALIESMKLSSMIFMVLIGASAFSLVFGELGGNSYLMELFTKDIGDKTTFIIISMSMIFILGFFIDFIEICFIVVPILVPIAKSFGIDLEWFALIIALNLQTSFLTPPFGFALFYLKGSAGNLINTLDIYKGVIPFILIQLLVLLIAILFPKILT